jgi:hypothetical protein
MADNERHQHVQTTLDFTRSPSSTPEIEPVPDVVGYARPDSQPVRAPAKILPKTTYLERPDLECPRASNRERQVWNSCLICKRWYAARACRLERGQNICCSRECWEAHVVRDGVFAGANNPRWLGGVSKDNMRYRRRAIEKWPEHEAARKAVGDAVRAGRLIKLPCEVCGDPKSNGHHEDYSRQLDVIWLCRPCHDVEHERLKRVKRAA